MLRRLTGMALVILAFTSCGKTGEIVPNVSVSIQVPISDPRLNALHNPTGAVLLNGGVAGIVLYRTASGGYAAYDRCSAYEPSKKCAVTLDNPSLTVTDPCSGSKWSLEDGTPVKAPAIKSLRAYTVSSSPYEIYISN